MLLKSGEQPEVMNTAIIVLGGIPIFLGLATMLIGSHFRGEMEIELGLFEGPIWFLLVALGVFTDLIGILTP
jgi:hypothetical protein